MNRWIVRAYEPWDSHRTHNGRTEERESEDGKWYKADEVADLAKHVLPYIDIQRRIVKDRTDCKTPRMDTLIADLEQIVKEGK